DLGLHGGLLSLIQNPGTLSTEEQFDPLVNAAFQAAIRSYSPYTHNPAGIAIELNDGVIFSGSYLENAAFNPSLSPLQVAIVNLVAAGREYQEINSAVLVERKPGNKISSQRDATQTLLMSIAPNSTLRVQTF